MSTTHIYICHLNAKEFTVCHIHIFHITMYIYTRIFYRKNYNLYLLFPNNGGRFIESLNKSLGHSDENCFSVLFY